MPIRIRFPPCFFRLSLRRGSPLHSFRRHCLCMTATVVVRPHGFVCRIRRPSCMSPVLCQCRPYTPLDTRITRKLTLVKATYHCPAVVGSEPFEFSFSTNLRLRWRRGAAGGHVRFLYSLHAWSLPKVDGGEFQIATRSLHSALCKAAPSISWLT